MIFAIKIVDADGDPVSNESVFVVESGLLRASQSQYTDREGWANFEFVHCYTFYGVVHVRGEEYPIEVGDGAPFQ